MIIRKQSFKIVLLTSEQKAHLQKKNKTNFQYIVKQKKKKKKSSVTNLIHTFSIILPVYASESQLKAPTPSALLVIESNSEYCWNSLVWIEQTVQFDTESSYCLLIVNKQEGTGW